MLYLNFIVNIVNPLNFKLMIIQLFIKLKFQQLFIHYLLQLVSPIQFFKKKK